MNISTGISEINFLSGASAVQKAGKAYLWPVYNAGAVTQIQKINSETASDVRYIKPYSADQNNQPSNIRHEEYASNGKIHTHSSSYYPGLFLNILA